MGRKRTVTCLYDWSFKTRGTVSQFYVTEDFRKKVSELPIGKKIMAPDEFYVFGRPNPYFDGGHVGSSNIKSIKKIDPDMLEIRTATARKLILVSLKDYRKNW